MSIAREAHVVELVDAAGHAIGSSTVDIAHRPPGLLHRAFSVVLVDDTGRMLLQQRAAVKTRFALRWANACCGHPRPAEPVAVAAERRLAEELGIPVIPLTEIGVHVYQAADPASGRIEYEYDHVLFGRLDPATPVHPDPDEVATVTWVSPAHLATELSVHGDRFAPWLGGVVDTFSLRVSDLHES
jgi:isopentenyl-diphosphate Delta-isomerase